MAIALVLDLPTVTREQYEVAHGIIGAALQPGNLVHIAGPLEDGWRVIEVWDSPDAAAAFFGSETARQAFAAAKIPPVQPSAIPIHTLASVTSMIP